MATEELRKAIAQNVATDVLYRKALPEAQEAAQYYGFYINSMEVKLEILPIPPQGQAGAEGEPEDGGDSGEGLQNSADETQRTHPIADPEE